MIALPATLIIVGSLFLVVAIMGFGNSCMAVSEKGKKAAVVFGLIATAMVLSGAILSDKTQLEECHCQNELEEENAIN